MKVLIIGSGPNWREAPFEDLSYEVWSYGIVADLLPRIDLVFEIHRRDQWEKAGTAGSEASYVERLNSLGKRIWMQKTHPDIPLSIEYPKKLVENLVGDQFFSTIAYQLGLLALQHHVDKDVEEVQLWGLDLCTYEEWANQRPNANRLIGFLQGRGIKVVVPQSSKLFGLPYSYGYDVLEESPDSVDALLVEGYAQLNAMMAKMADLHFKKRVALEFAEAQPKYQGAKI
jgi:hypothetical protein